MCIESGEEALRQKRAHVTRTKIDMDEANTKVRKIDLQIEAATIEVNRMRASLEARIAASNGTNTSLIRTLDIEAEI